LARMCNTAISKQIRQREPLTTKDDQFSQV
jgi:hypothetical protein